MIGWFRKKVKLEQMNSGLVSAFSRIREDLASQKKFLEDMYEQHHGFKGSTTLNHQRIADWIHHFDKSIIHLEKNVMVLEKSIREDFQNLTSTSLNLFKEAYAKNIKDVKAVKQEILKEVEVFMKDYEEKQQIKLKANVDNVDNVSNVKKIMPEPHYDGLSNPERWLVGVLFNADNPLSYSQIAQKTGKTINTVRVYMNQLKFKSLVDESTLPNGIKLFSLQHKAKVKKLYNL
ncbi:MAG: hypothetical protein KKF46_08085 [Nanoarchaeota archaeon]|nr:hypothetical protein [Nanoarchaeota archaeon]